MEWIKQTLIDEWNALGYLILGCIIIFVGLTVQDVITSWIQKIFHHDK